MFLIQLMQFGPAAGGLLLAVVAWWLSRRSAVALPGRARVVTAGAMAVAIAAFAAFTAWSVFPWWLPPMGMDGLLYLQLARFIIPLVLTILALVLLLLPPAATTGSGSAELAPRTVTSFASSRWLVGTTASALLALFTAISAGAASSADEAGRNVMFEVRISDSSTASSTIYGWWFSVPCLVAVAVVLLLAIVALGRISRPALATDRVLDAEQRRARSRNVLATAAGGVLLHLGVVFGSLHGTSTLRTGFDAGAVGFVEFGTSFAALGSVLLAAGYGATTLGFALWWGVLLTALRSGVRQPVASLAR